MDFQLMTPIILAVIKKRSEIIHIKKWKIENVRHVY